MNRFEKILYIPMEAFVDTSDFGTYEKAKKLYDCQINKDILYQINIFRSHVDVVILYGDFDDIVQMKWVDQIFNKNNTCPFYLKKVNSRRCIIDESNYGGYLIDFDENRITGKDNITLFDILKREDLRSALNYAASAMFKDVVSHGHTYMPYLYNSIRCILKTLDHGYCATDESLIADTLQHYTSNWDIALKLLKVNTEEGILSENSIEEIRESFEEKYLLAARAEDKIEPFEKPQKRLEGFIWVGKSRLPGIKSPKAAQYYLTAIATDDAYEQDVYFVNNTDNVLPRIVSEWLEKEDYQSIKDGVIPSNVSPSWIYDDIKPYQAVKIASQDIVYDSDGIRQFRISIFIKPNNVWKTAEVVNGTIGRDCVLLWEGELIPDNGIISLD